MSDMQKVKAQGARAGWKRWVLEAGVILVIVVAVSWWQTRDATYGQAPDFGEMGADGRWTSLSAWRAEYPGQAVALYFWADWCPVCSAQEGNVEALRTHWPVLTVAMKSGSPSAVASILAERKLTWPTIVDANGRITREYGLKGVPALVVIDRNGEIHSVAIGYTTRLGMYARLWLASQRQEKSVGDDAAAAVHVH